MCSYLECRPCQLKSPCKRSCKLNSRNLHCFQEKALIHLRHPKILQCIIHSLSTLLAKILRFLQELKYMEMKS